jgi:hypothetical protein
MPASARLLLSRFRLGGVGFASIALGVFATETLDTAGSVEEFLLAGEEWMAS